LAQRRDRQDDRVNVFHGVQASHTDDTERMAAQAAAWRSVQYRDRGMQDLDVRYAVRSSDPIAGELAVGPNHRESGDAFEILAPLLIFRAVNEPARVHGNHAVNEEMAISGKR